MGISVKNLLDSYFSVEELKDALYDIGEPVSGSKEALISRIVETWTEHNSDLEDLLEFLPRFTLRAICQFYKLDDSGTDETLIRRIVKSGIVEPFEKSRTPSSPLASEPRQPRREVTEQKLTPTEKSAPRADMSPRSKRIIEIVSIVAAIATIISVVLIFYDRLFP